MDVQHAMPINQNNTFSFKARLNRILTWTSPHKMPKLYRRHFDGESWTQNGRKFWASGLQTQSLLFFLPESVIPPPPPAATTLPSSAIIPPLSDEEESEPLLGSSCESPRRQMPTAAEEALFVSTGGCPFNENVGPVIIGGRRRRISESSSLRLTLFGE